MTLKIQENIPLAQFTTFQIGGPARYFVDVATESDVRSTIQWAKERGERFLVLAGGSNVLIPDEGLNALIMHITEGTSRFDLDGGTLEADFGCNLLGLIRTAAEKGLGGWEKLAGIPGSVGGAVRGNAGAFGPEIKDFVVSVRALHADTGEVKEFANAECDFSYRHSYFKDHPEWIITSVQISLSQTDVVKSKQSIDETIQEREKRHLQNVQAAGSFFMNPVAPENIVAMFEGEKGVKSREQRVPAGWLIEKAGMKGAKVGGAIASIQHPNYIVNTGGASAREVLELAQMIKREVKNQFGIELKEEAAILAN